VSEVQQVDTKCSFPLASELIPIPGYPPADHEICDFLTADLSQNEVYNRTCAFLEALFKHTSETIEKELGEIDLEDLTSEFRGKMTEGQTYRSVNDFRKNFYHLVIQKAKEIERKVWNSFLFCRHRLKPLLADVTNEGPTSCLHVA
jgi:hypothetical protein